MTLQIKIYGGIQKWLMLTWMESPDMKDLKFYIVYKDSTDDVIDFSKVCNDDYFLEKLIDDYLNGWVKFASLDLDPIPDSGQQ